MTKRWKLRRGAEAVKASRNAGPRQIASLTTVVAAVTVVRSRKKLGLPSALSTLCAFTAPPAVAWGFKPSRARDAAVWAAQMWAYKNAFEMPYDDEQRLRWRAHFDYPMVVDARLGGGMPPGQRLQRRLRRRGQLTWLDKLISFFYWTWEAEPHLVLGWIRWTRPERFASSAGRLAVTFNLTLVGYWAVPTAPPWWVSEKLSRMDGDVRRVMSEVASWVKRETNPTEGDHEMGANPFAAMPSDHFASAAMTAILLGEQGAIPGAMGWAYALALAFALLYLGEHYLVDELAGLMMALAVTRGRQPLERLAQSVLELGPAR